MTGLPTVRPNQKHDSILSLAPDSMRVSLIVQTANGVRDSSRHWRS
jgi:hypothetical protein